MHLTLNLRVSLYLICNYMEYTLGDLMKETAKEVTRFIKLMIRYKHSIGYPYMWLVS